MWSFIRKILGLFGLIFFAMTLAYLATVHSEEINFYDIKLAEYPIVINKSTTIEFIDLPYKEINRDEVYYKPEDEYSAGIQLKIKF